MTQVSSRLSVAGTDDPVVHLNFIPRLAGAFIQLSRTDFDSAVVTERARITNNAAGIYASGQRIEILGEVGYRVWFVGASAALSHANRTVIRPGLEVTVAADINTVIARAGQPNPGVGSNGDISVDWAGNVIYTKAAGAWTVSTPAIYMGATASYDPPTDDPNNIPVLFTQANNVIGQRTPIARVFTSGTYHYNVNMNNFGQVISVSAWGAGASGLVGGY